MFLSWIKKISVLLIVSLIISPIFFLQSKLVLARENGYKDSDFEDTANGTLAATKKRFAMLVSPRNAQANISSVINTLSVKVYCGISQLFANTCAALNGTDSVQNVQPADVVNVDSDTTNEFVYNRNENRTEPVVTGAESRQAVIERVVERVTTPFGIAGVSADYVDRRLAELATQLRSEMSNRSVTVRSTSRGVDSTTLQRQVDVIYDDMDENIENAIADLDILSEAEIQALIASSTTSIAAGPAGYLLQSTGTTTQWVATSTLGIDAGQDLNALSPMAVGNGNVATGTFSVAFGNQNVAGSGGYQSAFGTFNSVQASKTSAFGYSNTASGYYSSVFGSISEVSGNYSTAVGHNVTVTGASAFAGGYYSEATFDYATALGYTARAWNYNALAVGSQVTASGDNSVAVGVNSSATARYAASFGYGNDTQGEYSSSIGVQNSASGYYSSAFGYHNTASGYYASAFGAQNSVTNDFSTASGYYNRATGFKSTAMGYDNLSSGTEASSFGTDNRATGDYSSASGYYNRSTGHSSTAFGFSNLATGTMSTAFGMGNRATADYATAFGSLSKATAESAVAIGYDVTNNIANSLMIGPSDSAKITILSSGNVGIGTSAPGAKLDVNGNVNLAYPSNWNTVGGRAKLSFGNENLFQVGVGHATTTGIVGISSNNVLYLMADSAESSRGIAFVNSDNTVNLAQNAGTGNTYIRGSLGIGTTTPQRPLHVAASSPTFILENTSNSANLHMRYTGVDTTGGMIFGKFSDAMSGTQHMVLDTNGNLAIGTTTAAAKLSVAANGATFGPVSVGGNTSFVATFADNLDNSTGVQMGNSSTGTSADFRFLIKDTTGHYIAFAMPSVNNNVAPIFGLARSSASFIFNTGGTARDLAVGTLDAKNLIFGSNNAERMRITSTGNVGIGTTTPAAKLHVSGSGTALIVESTDGITPQLRLNRQNGQTSWRMSNEAGTLSSQRSTDLFSTVAATDFVISPTGNVGIGTTTPAAKLDVWGNMQVGTSSTPALFVSASTGRVGINTTSLYAPLYVYSTQDKTALFHRNTNANLQSVGIQMSVLSGFSDQYQKAGIFFQRDDGFLGGFGAGKLIFAVNNTADNSNASTTDARMVILPTGSVGIGTTTPAARLAVTGASGTGDIFAVASSTNARLLTVNSSGNLGIGITNPDRKLVVSESDANYVPAAFRHNASTGYAGLHFLNSSGTLMGHIGYANVSAAGVPDMFYVGSVAARDVAITSNSLIRMTVASGGNVGIGTTSPSDLLAVAGNVNVTGALKMNGDAGQSGYVLRSTGTGAQWVATSTLGFLGLDSLNSLGQIALGYGNATTTLGTSATAIGYQNTATGTNSVAVGYMNEAIRNESVLFGNRNFSSVGTSSVSLGILNNATGVSFDTTTGIITGTASATSSTGILSTSVGVWNNARGDNSFAAGYNSVVASTGTTGRGATAIGMNNYVGGHSSIGIGRDNVVSLSANYGIAMGYNNNTSGVMAISIGYLNSSSAYGGSTSIGRQNSTAGSNSVAIGRGNTVNSTSAESVAIGTFHTISGASKSYLFGYNLTGQTNRIQFGISDSAKVTIDDNGWIGVGSSSPSAMIAIRASSPSNTNDYFTVASSTNFRLFTIKSTGNVGIGTSTPGEKLTVIGGAQFTGVGSGAYGFDLNLTADGVLTTSASDERLKKNVEQLNTKDTLDKLMQLKPSAFDWKENGAHDIGLIAQEVEEIFPELVFTNKTDGYKGVNYSRLPALLIAGMQEINNTFGSFVDYVEDGIAYINEIVVKRFTAKQITVQNEELYKTGVTIYDQKTGEPICMFVYDGEMKTEPGRCEDREDPEEDQDDGQTGGQNDDGGSGGDGGNDAGTGSQTGGDTQPGGDGSGTTGDGAGNTDGTGGADGTGAPGGDVGTGGDTAPGAGDSGSASTGSAGGDQTGTGSSAGDAGGAASGISDGTGQAGSGSSAGSGDAGGSTGGDSSSSSSSGDAGGSGTPTGGDAGTGA